VRDLRHLGITCRIPRGAPTAPIFLAALLAMVYIFTWRALGVLHDCHVTEDDQGKPMGIVNIFSGSYCHGDEICLLVTERLGYERIDNELIAATAQSFKLSPNKLQRAITGPPPFWNNFTHEREKNIACLKVTLAELIQSDQKILHGFLGHLIPRDIPHVLNVCVIANFPYRVQQCAVATDSSEKEALKIVRKDDEERLQWTQLLFEKTPYDESLYDLVIPMQDTPVDQAVELICNMAVAQPLKPTAVGQLAARDFLLAARVNLALTQSNHIVDVTAKHGEVTLSINRHVMRMRQYQEELRELAKRVSGVSDVQTQLGPKYRVPAINPMANIELPPKVLLVDDEKEFVQTLSERLRTRDLPASIVYDGQQALDFVARDAPDVIVLDLMMPGIGGIEVLKRLKQTNPQIEVVVLTGHGSEREEQLAADLGAFAYLTKPVNIEVLAEVMRDAYRKVNQVKTDSGGEQAGGRGN
jgi:two-component system response regulator CpxR